MKDHAFFLLSLSFLMPYSYATKSEPCIVLGRSFDSSMIDVMVNDFGIEEKEIALEKTKIEFLEKTKVTDKMADFYATQTQKNTALHEMRKEVIIEIYKGENAMNYIVKYDYQNKGGKHNVFIGSLLANDYECSVRFNGYILVKREF